jgi:prepilin-type N-terminal cleavage/methylation domain-containing protein
MKLRRFTGQGFTLVEMLLAVSVSALMMAATIAASVCLQKSFASVDDYFASHLQQVRIIDYLSRDVKRSYIVTTSNCDATGSCKTISCTIPNYLVDHGSNQPTRAAPTLSMVGNKIVANYQASTVNNVSTSQGSVTLTGSGTLFASHFTSAMASPVPLSVVGTGIPAETTIQNVSCNLLSCQATMSKAATADNGSITVTVGALTNVVYNVVNQTVQRAEGDTTHPSHVTNIAATADNLIPITTDVELLNTEFILSSVTFLPMFAKSNPSFFIDERKGTTVFSLSYLRNKRRGDG